MSSHVTPRQLLARLRQCPKGAPGWSRFETVCIDILVYLFVPPLQKPKIQKRTYKNTIRRDAVFPNRNFDSSNLWGNLFKEFDARMVLFEFKNYHKKKLTGRDVEQACGYLTDRMGRLAILCTRKSPEDSAISRRSMLWNQQPKKLVLFLTPRQLEEMINKKRRGEDPTDLIVDLVEEFYLENQ